MGKKKQQQQQNLGSHHARGAEAAGHAARAHAFQVIVLAGLGAFEPFGPRVVSRAHQLDHGGRQDRLLLPWSQENHRSAEG